MFRSSARCSMQVRELRRQITLPETSASMTFSATLVDDAADSSFRNESALPPVVVRPLAHEQRPFRAEVFLSFVRVMRPTAKLQILDRGLSSSGVGHDVVKFQETRLAASAVVADKRAAAAVTSPHGTFDGCWKMSRH